MAHTDRTYRTPRPHRVVEFIDFNTDGSVDTVVYTQEFGRRAGCRTHKSDVTERRIRSNRNERRGTRRALRSKGSAIYFAS